MKLTGIAVALCMALGGCRCSSPESAKEVATKPAEPRSSAQGQAAAPDPGSPPAGQQAAVASGAPAAGNAPAGAADPPGAPPPSVTPAQRSLEVKSELTAIRDDMCKCRDKACTEVVGKAMVAWAKRTSETARDIDRKFETTEDYKREMNELGTQIFNCQTRPGSAASGSSTP